MAKKYEKTAKDKAWDQERTKLTAKIYTQKREYKELFIAYEKAKSEKIKLEDENMRLRELLSKLTDRKPEEIIKNIDDAKETADHVMNLLTLGGFFNYGR